MTSSQIVNQTFQSAAITPIARALGADTSLVAFNIRVTSGAQVPKGPATPPKLYFATTSYTIASGAAPAALARQASAEDLPIPSAPNAAIVIQTDPVLVLGANLHVWTDAPALDAGVTLEIDVVEV